MYSQNKIYIDNLVSEYFTKLVRHFYICDIEITFMEKYLFETYYSSFIAKNKTKVLTDVINNSVNCLVNKHLNNIKDKMYNKGCELNYNLEQEKFINLMNYFIKSLKPIDFAINNNITEDIYNKCINSFNNVLINNTK